MKGHRMALVLLLLSNWERIVRGTLPYHKSVTGQVSGQTWDSPHHSIPLRGGGARKEESARPQQVHSRSSSAVATITSAYLIVGELVQGCILPAIQDTCQNTWRSTTTFLRELEDKAIERRLEQRLKQEMPQDSQPQNSESKEEINVIDKKIFDKATSSRVRSQPSRSATTRYFTPSRLTVVELPTRTIKFFLSIWLVAEVLDGLGILKEEAVGILRSEFDRVWYDVELWLLELEQEFHRTWLRLAPGIHKIPKKHQFAIGIGIGTVCCPVLMGALAIAWQPGLAFYALSSLNGLIELFLQGSESVPRPTSLEIRLYRRHQKVQQSIRKMQARARSFLDSVNEGRGWSRASSAYAGFVRTIRHGFVVGVLLNVALHAWS